MAVTPPQTAPSAARMSARGGIASRSPLCASTTLPPSPAAASIVGAPARSSERDPNGAPAGRRSARSPPRARAPRRRRRLFEHGFHFGQLTSLDAGKLYIFATDADRVSCREGQKHATLRLQNPPRRATLSSWHSRTCVSQRHTTAADFAPCSPYEFRSPSRTAIPPAFLRWRCVRFVSIPTSPAGVFAQTDPTSPTQFDSGASFFARVPATNPAV